MSGLVEVAWRRYGQGAVQFATALVRRIDAHEVAAAASWRVTRQPDWAEIERLDRSLMRAVRDEAQKIYRQRRAAVPRSTLYDWSTRQPPTREQADTEPATDITEIHSASMGTYGATRILWSSGSLGSRANTA